MDNGEHGKHGTSGREVLFECVGCGRKSFVGMKKVIALCSMVEGVRSLDEALGIVANRLHVTVLVKIAICQLFD